MRYCYISVSLLNITVDKVLSSWEIMRQDCVFFFFFFSSFRYDFETYLFLFIKISLNGIKNNTIIVKVVS